jgi:hypothetical protein
LQVGFRVDGRDLASLLAVAAQQLVETGPCVAGHGLSLVELEVRASLEEVASWVRPKAHLQRVVSTQCHRLADHLDDREMFA